MQALLITAVGPPARLSLAQQVLPRRAPRTRSRCPVAAAPVPSAARSSSDTPGVSATAQGGDLVFPPITAEPGTYRFMIHDGTEVVTGYIGRATKSLAMRFGLYRTRGRIPSPPLKKTTNRNALCLIAELQAGNTVSFAVVGHRAACTDGQELVLDRTDKALRSVLKRRLILQLCETGIEVLNRNGNPSRERRL
jgi:hypothetical protein